MRTLTLQATAITAALGVVIPFLTALLGKTHDRTVQSIISFVLAVGAAIVGYIEANPTQETFDYRQLGVLLVTAGVAAAGTRVSWLGQVTDWLNYKVGGVIGRKAETLIRQADKRHGADATTPATPIDGTAPPGGLITETEPVPPSSTSSEGNPGAEYLPGPPADASTIETSSEGVPAETVPGPPVSWPPAQGTSSSTEPGSLADVGDRLRAIADELDPS